MTGRKDANSTGTTHSLSPDNAVSIEKDYTSSSLSDLKVGRNLPFPDYQTGFLNREPQSPLAHTVASLPESGASFDLRSQSRDRSSITVAASSQSFLSGSSEGIRQTIIRSFAPRVAVFASTDTEDFVKQKGFADGLYSLLKPYGERLPGKVVIRDSVGGSKGWDDFGVRFLDAQHLQNSHAQYPRGESIDVNSQVLVAGSQLTSEDRRISSGTEGLAITDKSLDIHLQAKDGSANEIKRKHLDTGNRLYDLVGQQSLLYPFYLRKLLSNTPITSHETFSHPIACMIAVSSRHSAPIEALHQLYANTGYESNRTPAWISTEYLRYYVLIHDEENDDISRSTALFDLMKRHFGLHCHLLRLRGSQCVETDDDVARVPTCDWFSDEEEMKHTNVGGIFSHCAEMRLILTKVEYINDDGFLERYIFESDAAAIRALVREMVTQSIVPFMESRVMTWNDQVASRRRGISGRFISLSKRWTGFGSSKGAASGQGAVANTPGNYDHQRGFYAPGTPEATMRRLGDYAFMLRDWRLAYSIYDFLRTDFAHDKAWRYYAAANEMAAITYLLIPQSVSIKSRLDNIDQLLDTASYSYLTRCAMPSSVIRCVTLAIELLKCRGTTSVDDAARWGGRLLELNIVSPAAQSMTAERVADCYMVRAGTFLPAQGARRRQAALWNVLASESWMKIEKPIQALRRLRKASVLYGLVDQENDSPPFPSMQALWQILQNKVCSRSTATLIDDGDVLSINVGQREQVNPFTCPSNIDNVDTEGFTSQDAGRFDPACLDYTRSEKD